MAQITIKRSDGVMQYIGLTTDESVVGTPRIRVVKDGVNYYGKLDTNHETALKIVKNGITYWACTDPNPFKTFDVKLLADRTNNYQWYFGKGNYKLTAYFTSTYRNAERSFTFSVNTQGTYTVTINFPQNNTNKYANFTLGNIFSNKEDSKVTENYSELIGSDKMRFLVTKI